ncbi:MAG: hypothetical protein A2Y62_20765 [Candidatus Fischerbacteria bacterium RBG_13_37_8]|uniref:Uncharacterized protein n=1 Tax=Candidatus Fischerbacteria bacterium RBG_13_37_8 TaxID=1817863 RepID=A0A1F5VXM2_9BACT|nr:MAG: hypothetical protein A2Y62_20765 [Candidatus Fischerbacteria bacterium RBG_13_37_8]
MPARYDASGYKYKILSAILLPMVQRSGGNDPTLTLLGAWWLLPLTFPSPALPLAAILYVIASIRDAILKDVK